MLSRVDGHTSFGELCLITGLGEQQTVEILKRLLERGLIALERPPAGGNGGQATRPAAGSSGASSRPPATASSTRPPATGPSSRPAATGPRTAPPATASGAEAHAARVRTASAIEQVERSEALARQGQARLDGAREKVSQAEARVQTARVALAQAEAALAQAQAERIEVEAEMAGVVRAVEEAHRVATAEVTGRHVAASPPAKPPSSPPKAEVAPAAVEAAAVQVEAPASPPVDAAAREVMDLLRGYALDLDAPAAQPAPDAAPAPRRRDKPVSPVSEPTAPTRPFTLLPEIKERIEKKHSRLAEVDLFELLEVGIDADKRTIKRSYFKLSKEFHPDRYFGRDMGELKDKLSDVFKALSQAIEYLSDEARLAEYRAMIEKQRELGALETALEQAVSAALVDDRSFAERELAKAADAARTASRDGVPLAGLDAEELPSGPVPDGSRAAVSEPGPPRAGSDSQPRRTPMPPPSTKAAPRRLLRQMLSQRIGGGEEKPTDSRAAKARRYYDDGLGYARRKEWVSAASNLKLAAAFEPTNAEYAAKLAEAEAEVAALQGLTHFQRGEMEHRAGRLQLAAFQYAKAASLVRPSSGVSATPSSAAQWEKEVFLRAAEVFLKLRQLEKAEEYGIKATERVPKLAAAHRVLGLILKERRKFQRASQAAQRALELDPGDKEAKALLDEVTKRVS